MNRSSMRTQVRQLINNTDTTSSQAFTDTQLNIYLFEAARIAQNLIEESDQSYFEEEATGTLAAGTATLALPAGCRKVIDLRRTDNRNYQFTYIDKREYRQISPNSIITSGQYIFTLNKSSIVFPEPLQEQWTYKLVYTKDIDDAADDNAEFAIPIQGQDFAIKRTALLALGGENNAPAFIQNLYTEAKEILINNIRPRVKVQPRQVKVTY